MVSSGYISSGHADGTIRSVTNTVLEGLLPLTLTRQPVPAVTPEGWVTVSAPDPVAVTDYKSKAT
ncbi:MAG: hypothetical protein WKF70_09545 [Chitinophagaceae bacterium]